MNGVEFSAALSGINRTAEMQGIVKRFRFIDYAEVTAVVNGYVNLKRGDLVFTNVEVLSFGCHKYSFSLVPAVGDYVLLLSSRTFIKDTGTLEQDIAVDSYSNSTLKCLPICSPRAAESLFILDENKISLKDADGNSLLINTDGITVTDKSGNTAVMSEDGISVTDLSENKVETTSDGITVTDANSNTVTMNSEGMSLADCNGNSVEMASAGITLKDANGGSVEMAAAGITIKDANGKSVETSASGTVINGKLTVL